MSKEQQRRDTLYEILSERLKLEELPSSGFSVDRDLALSTRYTTRLLLDLVLDLRLRDEDIEGTVTALNSLADLIESLDE